MKEAMPSLRSQVGSLLGADEAAIHFVDTDYDGDWFFLTAYQAADKPCAQIENSLFFQGVHTFKKRIELLVCAADLGAAYKEIDFSDPTVGAQQLWKSNL
jgi:hypothetical protein